jgi:competence protein ComEA
MAGKQFTGSGVGKSKAEPSGSPSETRANRRPIALAVLLTSLAWLTLAGGALLAWRQPQPAAFQLQPPPATATPAPTATLAPIQVDVAGAVLAPGVYVLPTGARAGDAITAAGGLAANADPASVNLARRLEDGEKLVAPTLAPEQPAGFAVAAPATFEGSGTRSSSLQGDGSGLIDINTANAQELEALPAIGPVTAQAIVDHRMANGPFRSIEDLVDVKGIGQATLDKIRDLIIAGQ